MGEKKFVSDTHVKTRSLFRFLGPLFLVVGAVCMIIAFIDFFTFKGFGGPSYFWLFFVGMPFIFFGFMFTSLGYGSAVAKYQSREYAPVAKDTINYLANETASGIRKIKGEKFLSCPNCAKEHAVSAKFCDQCGEKLVQICRQCEHENSIEANFCKQCGITL